MKKKLQKSTPQKMQIKAVFAFLPSSQHAQTVFPRAFEKKICRAKKGLNQQSIARTRAHLLRNLAHHRPGPLFSNTPTLSVHNQGGGSEFALRSVRNSAEQHRTPIDTDHPPTPIETGPPRSQGRGVRGPKMQKTLG